MMSTDAKLGAGAANPWDGFNYRFKLFTSLRTPAEIAVEVELTGGSWWWNLSLCRI
jgi:hypothetical protein